MLTWLQVIADDCIGASVSSPEPYLQLLWRYAKQSLTASSSPTEILRVCGKVHSSYLEIYGLLWMGTWQLMLKAVYHGSEHARQKLGKDEALVYQRKTASAVRLIMIPKINMLVKDFNPAGRSEFWHVFQWAGVSSYLSRLTYAYARQHSLEVYPDRRTHYWQWTGSWFGGNWVDTTKEK